ncbi:MAG: DNA topoisomerase IV subunit A [Candidatus Paracaedibacteraceae bacterium]|nr:DNA topoisomerase IV subunit A [Candidatus Paracaedibacteraceae bacterium]
MTSIKTDSVIHVDFEQALSERYLAYALSTIMSRSLPDVRDGLKPVHRRLIYAMQQLRLNPQSGFKKCARVVGDVMGKFHPHGDSAIYGALVRLAQDFSVRYPLIDGQGNFGNIDGDSAAAMRYTEARLTPLAMELMDGLDENSVDFRSTYDGEQEEPLVFPSTFPNLLANGSTGIAVGMATSIPPHNLDELCHGLLLLLNNGATTVAELVDVIPGPDFPTGGILVEDPVTILKAYETGRGSFRLRARYEAEDLKAGQFRIIITEIPYMVEKSKLIERIANLLTDKKLPLLDDIQDESTDEVRIALVPKNRNVDPLVLMESLFRTTDLEVRIPLNLNVLDANTVPRVMNIKEVLQEFLNHRRVVLERRTQHRLTQIANRLEILKGLLIVYLNLDEIIQIIREEDDPKAVMMARFELNETQAEAILNMRLRALRKIQEIEIRKEFDELAAEQGQLEALLADPKKKKNVIAKDLKDLQKRFGKDTIIGKRRTDLSKAPDIIVVPFEDEIEKEDVTVVLSDKNWIRTIKGHNASELKYKDGDTERYVLNASTTDKLLLLATNGRFFTLGIDKISRTRGHGDPIRLFIELENTDEIIAAFIITPGTEQRYLLASSGARGFIVKADDILAQTKGGKQVLTLDEKEKPFACVPIVGDHVAILGENRKLLFFPVADLPEMARGKGVTLQKYKDGSISDIKIIKIEDGLKWTRAGKDYHQKDLRLWLGKRAASGRLAPIGFPRTNKFSE